MINTPKLATGQATKIVHFFHDMSPKMTGAYTTLQHFLAAFPAPQYTSHVVSFDKTAIDDDGAAEATPRTRVLARQDPASRYYRYVSRPTLAKVKRLCQAADILFVHLLYRHHAIVAAELAKKYGKPLVIVPHGALDPYCFSYRGMVKKLWLRHYRELLTSRTTFLFATDQEEEKAAHTLGHVNSRIISWPCTMADAIHPRQRVIATRRGPLNLLFVGRLHPMKRVLETIQAMRTVTDSPCTLTLVGEPSPEISEQSIIECAGGMLNQSIFYAGAAYGPDLISKYMQCDGLVLFSHRENFGNVVAEAMACGKPVFISEGVDLAPLVAAHGCGMVFPIRDESDIGAALATIGRLSSAELAKMGQIGRTVAASEFSFAKFSQRLRGLADSLMRPAFSRAS